jgi:hypothetical protein
MSDELYVPQIDYTSRDYEAIRDDLIGLIPNFSDVWTSRESTDFGIVLLELFSYAADIMNYYIDRAANESFIDYSTQRSTVLALARLLNYTPNEVVAATGSVTFTNILSTSQTIPAGTVLAGTSSVDGGNVLFETDAAVTISANGTGTVAVTQGVTVTGEELGTSTGMPSQTFTLAETNVITGSGGSSGVSTTSILVSVGGISYTRVRSLVNSLSTDLHFEASTDSEGYTTITFGDGTFGKIPPKGLLITCTYRTGSGALGNVGADSITSVFSTPDTSYPSVNVTNPTATSGGQDPESTDNIRDSAPKALSTLNRAVSLADYANLALTIDGVAKANAVAAVYTDVVLYVAAAGGSATSSSLKSTISSYFADKIPPGTTVTVTDYTPVYPDVRVTVAVNPLYSATDVKARAQAALYDLLNFDNVTMNDTIYQADIVKAVATVEGVTSITITGLKKKYQYSDSTAATTVSDIYCYVNEVPVLVDDNIEVTSVGGIS